MLIKPNNPCEAPDVHVLPSERTMKAYRRAINKLPVYLGSLQLPEDWPGVMIVKALQSEENLKAFIASEGIAAEQHAL